MEYNKIQMETWLTTWMRLIMHLYMYFCMKLQLHDGESNRLYA